MAREPISSIDFAELPRSGLLEALTPDEIRRSAHYVTPEGVEYHGGEAITRVGRLTRWRWLARLLDVPLLWVLRELGYGFMATFRGSFDRATHAPPDVRRSP